MAGERDRANGDSSIPSDEARRDVETLHGVERVRSDKELDLPSHDTETEADPHVDSRSPSHDASGTIQTLHGERTPSDEDLDLPRHDRGSEADSAEHKP